MNLQVRIIIYIQHDNYGRISSCVGLLLHDQLKHVEGTFITGVLSGMLESIDWFDVPNKQIYRFF